ncbi:hypothetical protein K2X33_06475 [bacterium]|nr:hypothetical protein [bacterium]
MLHRLALLGGLLSVTLLAVPERGRDLPLAPASFTVGGKKAIPIDFDSVHLELELDPSSGTAIGRCSISFYAKETGYPLMDLVPSVRSVRLNGVDLGSQGLPTVTAPQNATQLRMVNAEVQANTGGDLEIEFTLSSNEITFSNGGVRMVWAMSDVGADRGFLERYACSNLEFDHFPMEMQVSITGQRTAHQIFTNGQLVFTGVGSYYVYFPYYFTTSSFYFHITNRPVSVKKETWQGKQALIPITVYGGTNVNVAQGLSTAKRVLAELESDYGPYAHKSLVVYLTPDGGGMEHAGATITSLGALGHEITHSWFARGVMPADGNAGWIDEAIASWRDNGYPRGNPSLQGNMSTLSGFATYARSTPMAAYTAGASLMSRWDGLFSGGLKPVLREVFSQAQKNTVSTPSFQALLEQISGKSLDDYFRRYVYGGMRQVTALQLPAEPFPHGQTRHPRPFTRAEIQALR